MKKQELIKSLKLLKQRKSPELYNIKDFKVFDQLSQRFTGDIWNEGQYIWKIECFSQLIKDQQPSTIFETGFNAGTSSCMFLNQTKKYISKSVKFYSNDSHKRSLPNVKLLKEEFSNFEFILGDSTEVLPSYLKEKNLQIDFAFVDGGHSYKECKADCINFQPYINDGGIIFVDDWWLGSVKNGALDAGWDGWTLFECPKYERGATIFLKDGGDGTYAQW